jgi:glyoxylase-like metal-dependent hydrolase (beta-lactamase superfamily II)
MSATVTQIRDNLWQTRTESPFPGLTTHAYVWRGPTGNVLFYSPASEADFDAVDELGGVHAQYLSHLDEAGPMLARVADRFGSRLHAPALELEAIGRHAHVDVPMEPRRYVDDNGVDIIPTPGHSDGSTCYLVEGTGGVKYLFTGDTMFPAGDGTWSTFLVPGRGSAADLRSSLELLATLQPDVVIASAFGGDTAIESVDTGRWRQCIAEALATVPT